MRLLLTVAALAAVLAFAGCEDDDQPASGASGSAAVSSDTAPATTAPATTTTATEPTATPAQPSDHVFFQSPSGNIGCAASNEAVSEVRCDIAERTFTPPPKPAECDVDYGNGLVIAAGSAPQFVCAGDTTLNNGPVLEYGQVNEVGSVKCTSREAGMTCLDEETGRGFLLARDRYELF